MTEELVRRCAMCGVEKRGEEAKVVVKDGLVHSGVRLDEWWRHTHREDCLALRWSESERLAYFMDHGSPTTCVVE